jgi:hypothetical protein
MVGEYASFFTGRSFFHLELGNEEGKKISIANNRKIISHFLLKQKLTYNKLATLLGK